MSEVNRLFAAAAAVPGGGGRVQRRNAIRPNSIEAQAIRDIGIEHAAQRRGSNTSSESESDALAHRTVFAAVEEVDDENEGPKTSRGA